MSPLLLSPRRRGPPLLQSALSLGLLLLCACTLFAAVPCSASASDPILWSWFGWHSASCSGTPAIQHNPVSGACQFTPNDGTSILINCTADGRAHFTGYSSSWCVTGTEAIVASGQGDGNSCFGVYSAHNASEWLGSASALCPSLLPDATVSAQDLRVPPPTPEATMLLPFELQIIDPQINGSYGLLPCDINADGRTDLVSIAWSGSQVVWYENLGVQSSSASAGSAAASGSASGSVGSDAGAVGWRRHWIADAPHAVYAQFADFDGDGLIDIAVASHFEFPPRNATTEGQLQWFKHVSDSVWLPHAIGNVQGLHRIAAGDFNSDGHPEIVAVPLFGPGLPPIFGPSAIHMFAPLDVSDPAGGWSKTPVNQDFAAIHNAVPCPKRGGGGGSNVLLACQQGLVLLDISRTAQGVWTAQPQMLYTEPFPSAGADWYHGLTAIDFSRAPPFFVGAVHYKPSSYLDDPEQPWHGDSVGVLSHPDRTDSSIDDLLSPGLVLTTLYLGRSGGHTVQIGDLNNDGCVDMAVGYRGAYGKKLMIFAAAPPSSSLSRSSRSGSVDSASVSCSSAGSCSVSSGFTQQILSERGTNMLALLDADGDGWIDLASVGWGDNGDPILALWTNKVGEWMQGQGQSSGGGTTGGGSSALTVWLIVLSCALGLLVLALLWKLQQARTTARSREVADPFGTIKMAMLQDS